MKESEYDHIVFRSGRPPLEFNGEIIAADSSATSGEVKNKRWHEVYVYKTDGGKYVVHVTYRTMWRGEIGHNSAEVFTDATDLTNFLTTYDVEKHVQGFPKTDAYAKRQSAMVQDLRARYEEAVSKVLAQIPGTSVIIK